MKHVMVMLAAKAAIVSQLGVLAVHSSFAPLDVTGVPFSAEWRETQRSHGTICFERTAKIARRTNGATYIAFTNQDGMPGNIEINDLTVETVTTLYPNRTFSVAHYPTGSVRLYSQQEMNSSVLVPFMTKDQQMSANLHMIPLGERQENGLTSFGQE